MTIEQVSTYQNKIFHFIGVYETKIDSYLQKQTKLLIIVISFIKRLLYSFLEVVRKITRFGRYATIPPHWIGIFFTLKKMFNKIDDLPIFKVGAHYIYGKPGSGKSTMTYHAMMDYAYMTGKCSYTTAYMELPRTDIYGKQYYYHQVFTPSEFFQDGTQVAGFEDNFNFVVYEEMLTQYHQRNNKEKSYNSEVLPMITSMGTQRHQGIDLFYFISQLPKSDISIMQMLKGYHIPKAIKAFDYKLWLDTGKFRFYIKGWRIESYEVEVKSNYDFELVNKHVWFYKNIYREDMKYFNRLNMKSHFSKLPKMKGAPMPA